MEKEKEKEKPKEKKNEKEQSDDDSVYEASEESKTTQSKHSMDKRNGNSDSSPPKQSRISNGHGEKTPDVIRHEKREKHDKSRLSIDKMRPSIDKARVSIDKTNGKNHEKREKHDKKKVIVESSDEEKEAEDREDTNDQQDDEVSEEAKQPDIGFEHGSEPATILGASDSSGVLEFLIKWKGSDRATLVPAKIANVKCPQIVIEFYESRLSWNSD